MKNNEVTKAHLMGLGWEVSDTVRYYTIEDLIDYMGLQKFLQTVSSICYDKQEHLLLNWQDEPSANLWKKAAIAIDKTASKIPPSL